MGKPRAVATDYKHKKDSALCQRGACESCEFRDSRDSRESSAELELALADFEGLDLGFERRCGNAQLCRRA
jgi:hypothetical protein